MSKKISLATYLAYCGICSRRNADSLVRSGKVSLNGVVVREPGTAVLPNDQVQYQGKLLKFEKKVYVLLNKPLNYISAVVDEDFGRKTVVDLVKNACAERLYPIGRLDYQTTGLILLTNDGDFAQKLAHPKYEVTKVYAVTLSANFKHSDLNRLKSGVLLEDGPMVVDDIYFNKNSTDYKTVNVVIHSGKNRIVRRIFQHIGYRVVALDRIGYAGLTKAGLKVGQWRYLTPAEIAKLKFH
jgi:23S rRNA pseudouridine2605 synthase